MACWCDGCRRGATSAAVPHSQSFDRLHGRSVQVNFLKTKRINKLKHNSFDTGGWLEQSDAVPGQLRTIPAEISATKDRSFISLSCGSTDAQILFKQLAFDRRNVGLSFDFLLEFTGRKMAELSIMSRDRFCWLFNAFVYLCSNRAVLWIN